ncbi:hypothetical protein FGE12_07330 [Aggregicoccus sp. 17bor-14]|uniref:clostripain-related cysteine peptidase n=1 Tax=Myxococcaceae TaxID=31 RepID=UPI00129CC30C|nr:MULTISPECIES: clostripain-related cysteine peptidase [Myxococcaceae]MBF5042204.1 hypothetical protein [Simulacricoccus sp. 17bor-14]MRI87980.1 hypothetical protein [Aggregicoccus sp. 17bor-14]
MALQGFGWRRAALALALLGALAGCSGDDKGTDNPDTGGGGPVVVGGGKTHPTTGESWTVLVYMVGDNNLEPFAFDDLAEMAQVGSSDKVKIAVQIDRAEGYDESGWGTLPNWTSTKRILVKPGAIQELSDLGELNMGSADTLSDFIRWGVKAYPADRYALVFWDHGGSWPGFGGDESTSQMDVLSIAELQRGLKDGMAAANLKQFSLIGFDACLMSTYEVALGLRPYGEYLVASEELEPGHGWDWRKLSVVKDNPKAGPLELAQALVTGFKAQAVEMKTDKSVTLAVTDLYALDDLKAAVDGLAKLYGSSNATAFGRAREKALAFGEMPDPRQSLNMVDLGDFAAKLAAEGGDSRFAQASSAVQAALAKAVKAHTAGSVTAASTGLSVYFPRSAAYFDASYNTLTDAPAWRDFLAAYHQGGASTAAVPAFAGVQSAMDADGLTVLGTLKDSASFNAITRATMYFGFQSGDQLVVLGDQPAQVVSNPAPGAVGQVWDLTYARLSGRAAGGTTAASGFVYMSVSMTQSEFVLTFPFVYQESSSAPQQFALRVVVVPASGTGGLQDTFYLQSEGGYGELHAPGGSTLQPLVQVLDTTTGAVDFAPSGDAFDATQAIALDFSSKLPSGNTAFGVVTAENYAGEGDSVYDSRVVP